MASSTASVSTQSTEVPHGSGNDVDLDAIFDLSPVASAILSPSFQIKRASRSLLDFWKVHADECLGRDILSTLASRGDLTAGDGLTRIRHALHTAVGQRAMQTVSGCVVNNSPSASSTSNGEQTWSIRIIPVFRADTLLSLVFEWTQTQPSASATTAEPLPQPGTPPTASLAKEETIDVPSRSSGQVGNPAQIVYKHPSNHNNLASGLSLDESFRILIQTVKDYAIFLLDVDGNITTWNAGAELNKGYTHEEIIGKHFSIFYGPEDIASRKPQRELEACLRDGRVEDEGWRFRKDGSRFWANVTITTIYKNGVHIGFGKVTRNMTERRAAELRLIAAYEESAKLKSDFLANMSHEIRTPMHGMLSACSLLLDTPLTTDQRETASIIDESGQVLLRVINDILDYSKLASGSFSIHADIVGVASIIASVVRSVQPTLQPDVRLQLVLASNLPRAMQGDPLRYRQIMQNIVSNAAKFTDKGHIRVESSVQSHDNDTYVILTKVTDSGIGIPEAAVHNLFAPFTQVDGTTTKRFQGTGLGLSICKSLVELMGGEIGFEPNPERQGSVFWFTVRFLKIKSLSQLSKPGDDETGERVRRRRALSSTQQQLSQFELEKAKTIPPPLDRVAAKTSLSKAEVDAGARPNVTEDKMTPVTSTTPVGISLSPGIATEKLSSSTSTPATTPSSDHMPQSPSDPTNPPCALRDSIASVASPSSFTAATDEETQMPTGAAMRVTPAAHPLPLAKERPVSQQEEQRSQIVASPTRKDSASSTESIAEDPQKSQQRAFERSLALLRSRAPGKRLLIAEDNVINQKVLLGMLRRFGFEMELVVVTSDGAQAVARAKEQPTGLDLCFMDISMPIMDGHEAAMQIRQSGITVPIVAMTAHALQGDREQCFACGMDDYIAKPVGMRVLVDKLLTWLPGEKDSDETAGSDNS